jgi:hypothetical protein
VVSCCFTPAKKDFQWWDCLLLASIVGIAMLVAVLYVASMGRYNRRSHRMNEKICSWEKRRPANLSAELWSECIAWASIAQGNICFSEEHTSYEAMCRFEKQLDEKLSEDVDLTTLKWIGDRLAETGPHGQRYMSRWTEQWNAILQRVEEGDKR